MHILVGGAEELAKLLRRKPAVIHRALGVMQLIEKRAQGLLLLRRTLQHQHHVRQGHARRDLAAKAADHLRMNMAGKSHQTAVVYLTRHQRRRRLCRQHPHSHQRQHQCTRYLPNSRSKHGSHSHVKKGLSLLKGRKRLLNDGLSQLRELWRRARRDSVGSADPGGRGVQGVPISTSLRSEFFDRT